MELKNEGVMVKKTSYRGCRTVVGRMTLVVKKLKTSEQRMEKGRVFFKKELRQALGGEEVLPDVWRTTANVMREERQAGVYSACLLKRK